MRNAFARSLLMAARQDPSLILLTGDLGYSVFEDFSAELPNQFINLGITEQSSISFAAGLAKQGFRPFYYSIGNFPTFRCFEQIRNDVVHMDLPVSIVAVGAGFSYGSAGYSHHLVEDIAGLRALNGLQIYSPHDPESTSECVTEILKSNSPSYLRIGRGGDAPLPGVQKLEDGPQHSDSSLGTILFTGAIGNEVLTAQKALEDSGIQIQAISLSRLSVINADKLRSVIGLKPFITVEEHVLQGGFGSAIIETLEGGGMIPSYKRMGITKPSSRIVGSTAYLRKSHGINSECIVASFKKLVGRD